MFVETWLAWLRKTSRSLTGNPLEVLGARKHAAAATGDRASESDEDWPDLTIEVEETVEEAVIAKKVRVAQEILIRKNITERIETVRDNGASPGSGDRA